MRAMVLVQAPSEDPTFRSASVQSHHIANYLFRALIPLFEIPKRIKMDLFRRPYVKSPGFGAWGPITSHYK